MPYGYELILDIHNCNESKFTRNDIEKYFIMLCDLIGMQRENLYFWDYQGVPLEERSTESHLLGTSAVQFISTSNITIHALDLLRTVFINIFSCKPFNYQTAKQFSADWFEGDIINCHEVERL